MEIYTNRTNQEYIIEEREIDGKQTIIVPVVMMVEGVHSGSHGALYHPATELSKSASLWENYPVMINHPQNESGQYISANEVSEQAVGIIHEPIMKGKKLRAMLHLDSEKLSTTSPTAISYLKTGKPLEVSIGVFSDEEDTPGEFEGKRYKAIARNHRPDHLAILPSEVGACSWSAGCGIRVNKKGGNDMEVLEKIKKLVNNDDSDLEEFEEDEGKFSDEEIETNGGPGSGPRKGGGSSKGSKKVKHGAIQDFSNSKYRIMPNQNVLNEMDNHHTKQVMGADKYGNIDTHYFDKKSGKHTATLFQSGRIKELKHDGSINEHGRPKAYDKALLNNKEGMTNEDITMQNSLLVDFRSLQANQLSYDAIMNLIWEKLRAMSVKDSQGTEIKYCYAEAVFDKYLIYQETTKVGNESVRKFYQQNYTIVNDQVEFTDAPVEVVKDLKYKVVQTNKKGEPEMADEKKPCPKGVVCKEAKVDALIAHKMTVYTLDDYEMLMGLDETILDKMTPIAAEPVVVNKEVIVEKPAVYKTAEELIQAAPTEMQDMFRSGLKLHNDRRVTLIQNILNNSVKGSWTEDTLKVMETPMLETLEKSYAPVVDYSGNAFGLRVNTANAEEPLLPVGF